MRMNTISIGIEQIESTAFYFDKLILSVFMNVVFVNRNELIFVSYSINKVNKRRLFLIIWGKYAS